MDDELPRDYPERIQGLRTRLALSQGGLARLVGVSRTTVTRWEQGRLRPQPAAWQRIQELDRAEPLASRRSAGGERAGSQNKPAPQSSLPLTLTSFIGRERERNAIVALLRTSRLVTLTGTGGSGKSRLALEVAQEGTGYRAQGTGHRAQGTGHRAQGTDENRPPSVLSPRLNPQS